MEHVYAKKVKPTPVAPRAKVLDFIFNYSKSLKVEKLKSGQIVEIKLN